MKPKEIMMVGDSIYKDVEGAKNGYDFTVLAKYGQVWRENGKADFETNDIKKNP